MGSANPSILVSLAGRKKVQLRCNNNLSPLIRNEIKQMCVEGFVWKEKQRRTFHLKKAGSQKLIEISSF